MTNTRTFTVQSPDDLLAVVPYVLGFHPEESLVLMTVGGGEDRVHARVDLPRDEPGTAEVVDTLSRTAQRNGARRVALVGYTDDQVLAVELVERLRAELAVHGIDVVEAIRADGERWFSLTGCTDVCCPAEGSPYDIRTHPFTAQCVLEGQVTLRNRQELADSLIGTDPDEFDAVGDAADRAADRLTAAVRDPFGPPAEPARAHMVGEGRWVRDRVCRFLADGQPLSSEDAGRMLVAVVSIEVRDVAWAEMSRSNALAHVALWRDLVRRCPHELVAAPAALLGFAAWLAGDGALAWCAVERCQDAEPDYRLAALLTEALAGGVSPSRWTPVPRSQLSLFAS